MSQAAHANTHGHHHGHDEEHDPQGRHISSFRLLFGILVVLLVLTGLTVYTAKTWHLGILGNASLAIVIAGFKCFLVGQYFMHLKHDNSLFAVIFYTCVAGLVCFLFFTMIDIYSRDFIDPTRAQLLTPIPEDVVDKARYSEEELAGKALFIANCAACHGANGQGGGAALVGDFRLVESDLVQHKDIGGIVAFVNEGRSARDPKNTSGFMMPPKGGNPGLTDADIEKIARFIVALAHPPVHGHGDDHGDDHGAAHGDEHHPEEPWSEQADPNAPAADHGAEPAPH